MHLAEPGRSFSTCIIIFELYCRDLYLHMFSCVFFYCAFSVVLVVMLIFPDSRKDASDEMCQPSLSSMETYRGLREGTDQPLLNLCGLICE